MNQPDPTTDRALPADWPPAVHDAFWTAVNAPTYEESASATLAFAQLLLDAPAAPVVPPAPTSRAVGVLHREAARIVACCPDHGTGNGVWLVCHCPVADDMRRRVAAVPAAEEQRCTCGGRFPIGHLHADTHQPAAKGQPENETPCGPTPDVCDGEAGEPCANHEREAAHAEGEHCFCGPECQQPESETPEEPRQACGCGQDGCEYCDTDEEA